MRKLIAKSASRFGFWLLVAPVMAVLSLLMIQIVSIAWIATRSAPVATAIDVGHRISWASLDMMILEGDDFAQLLGWILALGIMGGVAAVLLRTLHRKH